MTTETFWVGNQPNPDDRTQIQVNRSCATMIERATQRALRGEHFELDVFDYISDRWVTLADESCGLSCRCALRFVRRNVPRASMGEGAEALGERMDSDATTPDRAREVEPDWTKDHDEPSTNPLRGTAAPCRWVWLYGPNSRTVRHHTGTLQGWCTTNGGSNRCHNQAVTTGIKFATFSGF
jgi:hypothetical protein